MASNLEHFSPLGTGGEVEDPGFVQRIAVGHKEASRASDGISIREIKSGTRGSANIWPGPPLSHSQNPETAMTQKPKYCKPKQKASISQ